ncbi:RNA polymerase sigma factor SigM [Nocardia terpenica]|uniref:RNA polymerase sigma factor SigM n=1 Tax=Nocardia terpenica TaxID=455432 RepID=UPI001895944B|nr:RNA polymerase sigma factor SigM [Nocardia terpenica]MBF6063119.1 RNA polymerase sigma factor SigM [Nocardia terpenica]MBF6104746.1 RNA polymerase sigma factor SigM [Nocardia terpenica]MBF6112818.1 RNA polymerase sigma factor SigM [Nocardia terpenica]MBF6118474.1 RNA polymerase sigma factor SigM [Nocardia terpenica]MBF6154953.1 RNA polymerase sigma factor SigM [Nocardia terpenica]
MRRRVFDPDEATDRELLAAHAAGNPHAFTVLFRRHYDHLWQLAVRTSYTTEDAADSLQDALLSAHRNAATFRGEAEVRSWLHRIVVNACLDRIRRNKARRAVSLSDENVAEPVAERDDIAELEMSMVVDAALFTLPPEQRTALVAIDIERYTVAEAAAMLGVAEGTIKSRCARGRERLKQQLEFLREQRNRT